MKLTWMDSRLLLWTSGVERSFTQIPALAFPQQGILVFPPARHMHLPLGLSGWQISPYQPSIPPCKVTGLWLLPYSWSLCLQNSDAARYGLLLNLSLRLVSLTTHRGITQWLPKGVHKETCHQKVSHLQMPLAWNCHQSYSSFSNPNKALPV